MKKEEKENEVEMDLKYQHEEKSPHLFKPEKNKIKEKEDKKDE
jgi:hypothetical protein